MLPKLGIQIGEAINEVVKLLPMIVEALPVQPFASVTITVYEPGSRFVNIPFVFVVPPFIVYVYGEMPALVILVVMVLVFPGVTQCGESMIVIVGLFPI